MLDEHLPPLKYAKIENLDDANVFLFFSCYRDRVVISGYAKLTQLDLAGEFRVLRMSSIFWHDGLISNFRASKSAYSRF